MGILEQSFANYQCWHTNQVNIALFESLYEYLFSMDRLEKHLIYILGQKTNLSRAELGYFDITINGESFRLNDQCDFPLEDTELLLNIKEVADFERFLKNKETITQWIAQPHSFVNEQPYVALEIIPLEIRKNDFFQNILMKKISFIRHLQPQFNAINVSNHELYDLLWTYNNPAIDENVYQIFCGDS